MFCFKGVGQDKLGIYIKQVVKDGPAAKVCYLSNSAGFETLSFIRQISRRRDISN